MQAAEGKFNPKVHVEYDWNLRLEEMDESDDDLDDKVWNSILHLALVIFHPLKIEISCLLTVHNYAHTFASPVLFSSQALLRKTGDHKVSVTHPACLLMISSPSQLSLSSVINRASPTACLPIRCTAFPLTVPLPLSVMHHLYHPGMQEKVKQNSRVHQSLTLCKQQAQNVSFSCATSDL